MPEEFRDPHGIRWRAEGEWRALLERNGLPRAGEAGADWVPLKISARREVFGWRPPALPGLVVKVYPRRRSLPLRLKERLRSRAAREFERATLLRNIHLPVPEPVACGYHPETRESFLVSLRIEGSQALGPYLEGRFRPRDRDPVKLQLVGRALDLLELVHAHGFLHRDFHAGNLLLRLAEGPRGRLWLIDLASTLDLGSIPDPLRAHDLCDLLHSLRYVLARDEIDALLCGRAAWVGVDVRTMLRKKRRRAGLSRAARALVRSSGFGIFVDATWKIHHVADWDAAGVLSCVQVHSAEVASAGTAVLRIGRRSILSLQQSGNFGTVVVKEFAGSAARSRVRQAFLGSHLLRSGDVPTPRALACVFGRRGCSSFLISSWVDATPLHLLAERPWPAAQRAALARRISESVRELLVTMHERGILHSDLAPKNWLITSTGKGPVEVLLVDTEAVASRKTTTRRWLRTLMQLGDLPESAFTRLERARFVRSLVREIGLRVDVGEWLRASRVLIDRRRHRGEVIGRR